MELRKGKELKLSVSDLFCLFCFSSRICWRSREAPRCWATYEPRRSQGAAIRDIFGGPYKMSLDRQCAMLSEGPKSYKMLSEISRPFESL